MIIDCIADLHGWKPGLRGGDLLIIAGDCTDNDSIPSWTDFFNWLKDQDYKYKIIVAGNHDNFCKSWALYNDSIHAIVGEEPFFIYLYDSGIEIEGLKIWGSPWTPWFKGVNPKCKAFMKKDVYLAKKWKNIPKNLDILITHSPAYGILDGVPIGDGSHYHCGSQSLLKWFECLEYVERPRVHVFGHIHESHGYEEYFSRDLDNMMQSINCSYVDGRYRPVNAPFRLEL